MIESLKKSLEADPDNPFLQGHVEALTAAKEKAEASRSAADCSKSPWRPIGELGEIAYMENGSCRWVLWAGYEEMRMFLVYLTSGEIETHYARIDDSGMLCNEHGDDLGRAWYDAEYFMDIPEKPTIAGNA